MFKLLYLLVLGLFFYCGLAGQKQSDRTGRTLPVDRLDSLSANELEKQAKKFVEIISFELKSLAAVKRRETELSILLENAESERDWDLYTELDTEQRLLDEEQLLRIDFIRESLQKLRKEKKSITRQSRFIVLEQRVRALERQLAQDRLSNP